MVHEHLWPRGEQPVTRPATLRLEGGRVILASETPGASLGFREGDSGPWTIYTGPFPPGEAAAIEVLAHRIGFAPARARLSLP